jgi:RNA polymerase sigma-70 factor (ECF subfamily)
MTTPDHALDATRRHDDFLRRLHAVESDLRAFLASAVRDWARADDLMQDVTLALWRSYDRYDPTRPFGAWARGVATHLLYQEFERSRRGPRAVSAETAATMLAAFDRTDTCDHDQRRDALRQCLAALDAEARETMRLRYGEGLDPGAIATRTRRTLAAIKKALTRTKARLEACITRRLAREATP